MEEVDETSSDVYITTGSTPARDDLTSPSGKVVDGSSAPIVVVVESTDGTFIVESITGSTTSRNVRIEVTYKDPTGAEVTVDLVSCECELCVVVYRRGEEDVV